MNPDVAKDIIKNLHEFLSRGQKAQGATDRIIARARRNLPANRKPTPPVPDRDAPHREKPCES